MPVIVIGADTPVGRELIVALADTDQEVRAFVTDPAERERMRPLGVKVAVGDVSDSSHVEGACTNAFTAVLVSAASTDDRERSFARTPEAVLHGWAEAVAAAHVQRVIWVDDSDPPRTRVEEEVLIHGALATDEIVRRVVALDEADSIPCRR
jgi:uncharacterized protein YbjT (DUF2867 family)